MLNELLSMDWNAINLSDYRIKPNTMVHVMEISGSEISPGDDSIIVVYYRWLDGKPIVCVQRYERLLTDDEIEDVPGFIRTVERGVSGENATEITYVSKSFIDTLD